MGARVAREMMRHIDSSTYRGRRVFITGHTGFKGSYLALWLHTLGSTIYGYALRPLEPSHYTLANIQSICTQEWLADINDYESLESALQEAQPEIVFHLAAQPLVRTSYHDPLETFATNALNACRKLEHLRAVVIITTDKVYDNREWIYGYRECDRLGGYDPYSASKACAEIITDSMRRSFFHLDDYGRGHSVLIATARAGNVIGGGDFSCDRLLPDLVRAACAGEQAHIRNPHSTRPWQFVLEPLWGYLLLGQALLQGRVECASSFNFGPASSSNLCVREVLELAEEQWDKIAYIIEPDSSLHESGLLMLDSAKARAMLGFAPIWSAREAIAHSVAWYREWYQRGAVISLEQLVEYVGLIRSAK